MKKIIKISLILSALFLNAQTSEAAFVSKNTTQTEVVTNATNSVSTIVDNNVIDQKETSATEQQNKSNIKGGKSQLIALLLCILVGGLGIHRFYLGYTGIGIIQLLTAGGLGIWWLIDLIRIIMGTLKPKGGEYEETL